MKTFTRTIKNDHFIKWPGLTTDLITRNLPKSLATYQGHVKSEKQGLQSTKILIKHEEEEEEEQDYFPPSDEPNVPSNHICYALMQLECESTACVDLMGRFPKKSSRGNEYILVRYHYDRNYIHGHSVKDKK